MSRKRKYPLHYVVGLYLTGMSQVAVARKLKQHHTTVQYALDIAGVERHARIKKYVSPRKTQRRRIHQLRAERIIALYDKEKYSTPQIAEIMGLDRSTVYSILVRHGGDVIRRRPGIRTREIPAAMKTSVRREPTEIVEHLMALSTGRTSRKRMVA